jgi:DNA polymerase delta subunit 2
VRDLQQCILKPPPSSLKEGDDKPLRLTELEALEQTLQWSHLCPTAPDRIGVVPSDDVMVMNKVTPNIYFCGNCEEGFATKLINNNVEKTRLICIPKFNETGEAVLVNLKTLDVELLRFQVKEDFGDNNGDSDTGKKNTAKL